MPRPRLAPIVLLFLAPGWLLFHLLTVPDVGTITGMVRDREGPVAGAVVRVKGTASSVRSDADGRFVLPGKRFPGERITAWKAGYVIAGASADAEPLVLTLERLPEFDSPEYGWVDPAPNPSGRHNCANCHAEIYREWLRSGHAQAAVNRRFRNLYEGSDWQGRTSVGWNLLADHPDGAGVCASCHAPGLDARDPAFFDLREVGGVAAHGVHCDYCHKIADVEPAAQPGLTHGRFGFRLLRPHQGQLFFGPLADVDRGEDAFSPLYRSSRYCASCHEGVVFGVHVYSTYSEWLQSPAAKEGKQCQDCHMAPTGRMTNLAPGRGGIERRPQTLSNHRMFAGSLEDMLRSCLQVSVRLTPGPHDFEVAVEVRAQDVGHQVPTGFVDRHLVLVVEAWHQDQRTGQRAGPVLPLPAGNELAGLPGRLFAKQLAGFDGQQPAPFWRARSDTVDSRLHPGRPERSLFRFDPGPQRVRVRLLYRRFWQEVAAQKGWPDDTIPVFDREWAIEAN